MPKEKHILFIVPDGVGIKNYLFSDIISYLKLEAKITVWSPLPVEAFADVEKRHNVELGYKYIQLLPESILTRLYREATTYARLIHNSKLQNNSTILTNWRRPNYSIKVKVLFSCAQVLGYFLSNKYIRILRFEKKSLKRINKFTIKKFVNELEVLKPSHIFITHQRVPGLMPICLAAKKLNIKTTSAIFSWDNLPKARLAVKTDNYLVWSKWMKDEMKIYYPEIPGDNVKLLGTPQFEFYFDEQRTLSRQEFANLHSLDVDKTWICFSGDDVTTSPFDQFFLRDVAEALQSKREEIQIIFRRCPVDFSSRYDAIIEEHKNFIVPIDPIWNIQTQTGWVGYFPKHQDINMQINLAQHCDLVINLGSTMALDFATYDKPCLYLNYNPLPKSEWSTEIIYNFQHFRSMKGLDAVGWINSKEDIEKLVLSSLNNPQEIAKDRKDWLKTLVLHPLDENSKKIALDLL
jgi:hypothetical protein